MKWLAWIPGVALALTGFMSSTPSFALAIDEDGDEAKKWQEMDVQLPPMLNQQDLLGFYVSAATENRFFVDPASLSVGEDGVVRYALVILSGAGVRNVSFEGMRCETRERRLYAVGRSDGTWSKSRNSRWERIREASGNRHHAALFQDYFCPDGVIVRNVDEARLALKRGGQSLRDRW